MRQIDGKYQTTGELQKLDGTPIPADEPLILFRGKDKLLPTLLREYIRLCEQADSPERQIQLVEKLVGEIEVWQASHPDKVKVPD
jgi:hypothetical protein